MSLALDPIVFCKTKMRYFAENEQHGLFPAILRFAASLMIIRDHATRTGNLKITREKLGPKLSLIILWGMGV